jgi:DNA-binding response OmpR family regulator
MQKPEEVALKHILVIDDDIHIGDMLEEVLVREGYAVSRAYSGTEAVLVLSKAKSAQAKPDLILLDLMLPGLSGEEVLPHIKEIPVIVLSAKVDVQDKVDLLLGGAADYMTKPFDTNELLARITVQLRKAEQKADADDAVLAVGDLVLDTAAQGVTVAGRCVKLTRTEFAILKLLMSNPRQVISRNVLLDRISQDTPDCTERSLKQHISNLRKKLQEGSGVDYIETVWGIGFKLAEQTACQKS